MCTVVLLNPPNPEKNLVGAGLGQICQKMAGCWTYRSQGQNPVHPKIYHIFNMEKQKTLTTTFLFTAETTTGHMTHGVNLEIKRKSSKIGKSFFKIHH